MKQVFKVVREPSIVPASGEGYTLGRMYLDNVFLCHTCEDYDRKLEDGGEKIYGQTAIPRGSYRLTVTFSNRFQKPLPLAHDVTGFEGIRIHGGNTAENSHGCILVGKVRTANGIAQCADMVSRIIRQIEDAEDLGIESWLEIE